jgi:hypothetical protein
VVDAAPRATKRIVNPMMKAILFFKSMFFPCSCSTTPPARYEKYSGRIGRIQGLIKLIMPSRNAVIYAMAEHITRA